MNKIIIVGAGRCSGRTFAKILSESYKQNSESLIVGINAQDATQAIKHFTESISHATDAFDQVSKLIKDWKFENKFSEKPRGVIPEKYKNRRTYGKP